MATSKINLSGRHPIISDQIKRPALEVVLHKLNDVLRQGIKGDITEFGCYIGTTSLFIRRLLDGYETLNPTTQTGSRRQFHVYDSFAGLPSKAAQDMTPIGADFKAGELNASKKQLINEFQKADLRPPIIHKAWFGELTDSGLPQQIAFAFLDGDFYQSIIDSLRLVWPRLQPGATICIDDYKRDALPGVERAVRDFFQNKPVQVRVAHNIGIIRAR